jgi:hypothetical protein
MDSWFSIMTNQRRTTMTTNAFVKALRGPDDTPAEISPLSYIKDAIRELDDLETAIKERDDDPESFFEATAELKVLQANLTAALAVHDQAAKTYDRDEAERHINMLYGCPGAQYEVDTGVELLHDALRKFGLTAFTDEFITELACAHRREDEAMGQRAEADYHRSLRRPSISEPF